MRKKGFTLIELLAVILILGIIALIAIPTVTKIIETAKKNSLKVSASGVLEAGNYYYATNGKDIEDEIVFSCSGNRCINGDKVVNYSGNIENGILVIKKNGDMGICINSGKYYASKDVENDTIELGKGYCDSYSDGIFIVNSNDIDKYKQVMEILLTSGAISWNFDYIGSENEFLTLYDGIYKLEVWGASGGNTTYNSYSNIGGYGAYSVGNINLVKGDKLYINIGGQGQSVVYNQSSENYSLDSSKGYNGGGYAVIYKDNSSHAGGGGATHISFKSGLLSSLSVYKGEYSEEKKTYISNDIIIVAGAGGGASTHNSSPSYSGTGGSGGGFVGSSGLTSNSTCYNYGTGGTQTDVGTYVACSIDGKSSRLEQVTISPSFGKGANYDNFYNDFGYAYSSGGSGFYGGNSGYHAPGGGGSSYIGNPSLTDKLMYCYNCTESSEENIFTVNTMGTNELRDTKNCLNGYSSKAVSKCAKVGNGYAKITLVGLPKNFKKYKELFNNLIENNIIKWDFNYNGSEQILEIPSNGIYKLEVWGAQGGSYDSTYIGGYGGYSVGNIKLQSGQTLYINTGGSGICSLAGTLIGGYNGGGTGYGSECSEWGGRYGASGGGATHIALETGLLSSLENKKNKILIVAGGGGGSHYKESSAYGSGGSGGGFNGNTSIWTNGNHSVYIQPVGGNQEIGGTPGTSYSDVISTSGTFGIGGSHNFNACNEGSGGGGGYYGGGAGRFAPGAGGSGYIGNSSLTNKVMYCYNCIESDKESMKTVSTNNVSSNAVSNYAKSGNGYARITLISID